MSTSGRSPPTRRDNAAGDAAGSVTDHRPAPDTPPREGALISNDEVATWVAAHPDRFAGLAAVDLAKPMVAVRELRRAVTELGFKGLRVVPWL